MNEKSSCRVLTILVALWVLTNSPASLAMSENTIIMFGDSITFTYKAFPLDDPIQINREGSGEKWGWTIRELKSLLDPGDGSSIVLNYGTAGTSSLDGANRLQNVINDTKVNYPSNNYYVFILYGTNDGNPNHNLSPSQTASNVATMISTAKALGITPVVGTLLPRKDRDVAPYNQAIVGVANSGQTQIVDHHLAWQGIDLDKYYRDNVHPNKCGSEFIARTWHKVVFNNEVISSGNVPLKCDSAVSVLKYYAKTVNNP